MDKAQLLKKISRDFWTAKKAMVPVVKRIRRAKLIKANKPSRDYAKHAQWWLAYFVQYHVPESSESGRVEKTTKALADAGFDVGDPIKNTVGGLYEKQFGDVNVVATLHFIEGQDPKIADPTFLEITYTYIISRQTLEPWRELSAEFDKDSFIKLLRKL